MTRLEVSRAQTTPEPDRRAPRAARHARHPWRTRDTPRPATPVVQPLVQSVNHVQALGTAEGLKYTRYGNTPNARAVQKRLALLEGAEASLVLSSGMGATACAMLALLRPGDHLLTSTWIYGGTHRLFVEELPAHGVIRSPSSIPPSRAPGASAIKKETRAIFVESPVNPTCRVLDLRPLST